MALVPLRAQLFYSGQWNEVGVDYGLNRKPVTIKRGISAEGGLADPTEVALQLDNRDGRFNTRHPGSALRRLVGRSTPLRVSVGTPFPGAANSDNIDTTSHVAPSVDAPASGMLICGFAAPDPAGTYTAAPAGMTATATTAGAQLRIGGARLAIGAAGATGARTATFSAPEDYVACSVFVPGLAAWPGSSGFSSQITTAADAGDWWIMLVAYASSTSATSIPNGVDFRPYLDYPWDSDGGGWTALADTGSVFMDDAQARYMRMKAFAKRVKHTNAAHLIELTWRNIPLLDNTGDSERLGVLVRAPGDQAATWSPRASAKVTNMAPRRDKSGRDRWVEVQARGILGELSAGTRRPVTSPIRRALSSSKVATKTIGYWPCEDGTESTLLAAQTPNAKAGLVVGDVSPGGFSDLLGSDPLPSLNTGHLLFHLPSHSAGLQYHHALLSVPAGGLTDQQQLYRVEMVNGMVFQLRYTTGGGLRLLAFNADGVQLDDTGPVGFAVNGTTFFVQLGLDQNGANVDTHIEVWKEGVGGSQWDDQFTGITIRRAARVRIGYGSGSSGLAAGHVLVASDDILASSGAVDLNNALAAFDGERAAGRMLRLCREAGVLIQFVGDPAQTRTLGPQQRGTLLDLLRHVEAADHGILYEPKEDYVLAYRTGSSLSRLHGGSTAQQWTTQPVAATVDAGAGQLDDPWTPDPDEFAIVNDVTVKRINGSSARAVQESGPLNVGDSATDPDAAGLYPASHELNLFDDQRLASHAGELLRRGTVPEPRVPQVGIHLFKEHDDNPELVAAVAALDPGDRLTIANPPDDFADDVRQVVLGAAEDVARDEWHITLNGSPASPYVVGVRRATGDAVAVDDPSRRDTAGSELNADLDVGVDTSMSVLVTLGSAWGQTAAANMDFPFDVNVDGVRLRVTAIGAPAAGVQTFTIQQQPINDVDTPLTVPAGEPVRLWQPAVRALGGSEDA